MKIKKRISKSTRVTGAAALSFRRNTTAAKVPVTMRALLQRINRELADDNERLYASRSPRAKIDLGNFYVIRFGRGGSEPSTNVVDQHVDPEALGREMGVLRPWEGVIE
jgi:hypothetical protein